MESNLIILPGDCKDMLDILKLEQNLYDATLKLIENSQDILRQEQPYFFPDYPFHGVEHVRAILLLAEKLIANESREALTATGVFLLISAIITHDIGMFIGFEGFRELVSGRAKHRKRRLLDIFDWQHLWDEYLNEIMQYSEEEVLKNFGKKTTIEKTPDLSNKLDFSEFDRRICGKFIRKYHHRLSHEMVYYGFLGEKDIELFGSIRSDFRHLIGLIGRSHGIPISETEPFLIEQFGELKKFTPFSGVPVLYLMAVLRVCDYLDLGEHRAPHSVHDSGKIPSEISEFHWAINQAIESDLDFDWTTIPNTLHISATPKDTSQFNYLRDWISDVQKEIDDSALLLRRSYGQSAPWHFSIYTIAGLDNPLKYIDEFVTEPAKVKINSDIISLLVAPLYDYNPSCGLREIIQNATDACRERKIIEQKRSNFEYTGEVKIKISTIDHYIEISDNGVGMTKETLINYYLTVGASYRKDKKWLSDYTAIDGRKSIVPRTGKFGVGVLASFLLGKRVSVKTKNINDEFGCSFSFGLEDSIINIVRDKNIDTGTIVKIDLEDEILEQIVARQTVYSESGFSRIVHGSYRKIKKDISLYQGESGGYSASWNSPNLDFSALNNTMIEKSNTNFFVPFIWYLGTEPKLIFDINSQINESLVKLPCKMDHLRGWFSVENAPFSLYLWSYSNPLADLRKLYIGDNVFFKEYDPLKGLLGEYDHFHHEPTKCPLFYNGIIVPNSTIQDDISKFSLHFETPILSLTDFDSEKSKFTIALNRNSCQFPNIDLLYCEQIKYFFAALLTCPHSVLKYGFALISGLHRVDFIFYKDGFISHHKPFLHILMLQKVYGIVADVDKIRSYCSENAFVQLSKKDVEEIDKWGNIDYHGFKHDWDIDHYNLERNNMRTNWDSIKKGSPQTKLSHSDIPSILQNSKRLKLVEFLIAQTTKQNVSEDKQIFGERFGDIYKPEEVAAMQSGDIDEHLSLFIQDVLNNDILIPYSMSDRKTKYKKAFTKLTTYIEYWEEKWKSYSSK